MYLLSHPQANDSFATAVKVADMIHKLARAAPALGQLGAHRAGLGAVRRLLATPQFAVLMDMLLKGQTLELPDLDIDNFLNKFGDMDVRIACILSFKTDMVTNTIIRT